MGLLQQDDLFMLQQDDLFMLQQDDLFSARLHLQIRK